VNQILATSTAVGTDIERFRTANSCGFNNTEAKGAFAQLITAFLEGVK